MSPYPQERIQKHTVEQIIETSLLVPILDDPVPLQLVEIFKIIHMSSKFVETIGVPKIVQDSIPQRNMLPEPRQLVEQLVDVLPPSLTRGDVREMRACHRDAANRAWFACVGTRGSAGGSGADARAPSPRWCHCRQADR